MSALPSLRTTDAPRKPSATQPPRLRSGKLSMDRHGVITVQRNDARTDASRDFTIDLREFNLPATNLVDGCSLADDVHARTVVLLALDRYLVRSNGRRQHSTAANKAAVIAKLFEYCRLHNCYSPSELTQEHYDRLAVALSEGQWPNALELIPRCQALLESKPNPRYLEQSSNKGKAPHITKTFRFALRTNCVGRELSVLRQQLYTGNPHARRSELTKCERFGVSQLRQIFETINDLALLEDGYAIGAAPYPESLRLGKKLGRQARPTKNLSLDQAAPLLAFSMRAIFEQAEIFLSMLDAVYRQEVAKRVARNNDLRVFAVKSVVDQLSLLCGVPVSVLEADVERAQSEYNSACRRVLNSCFLVIAAMNGRRKQEVIHRRYGLHYGCVQVISSDLGVYQCEFYIEKTYKDYLSFYVNESTFKAVTLLCRMRALAERHFGPDATTDPTENTLFRCFLGRFGRLQRQSWHSFDLNLPHVREFLGQALDAGNLVEVRAHMFRRFYAIIFFYRYEDATLQALSQQLCHLDLEMTRQYLVDSHAVAKKDRIPVEFTASKLARDDHHQSLEKALAEVQEEKFAQTIQNILEGKRCSGGFEKLVRRLHNKLAASAQFRGLSITAKTSAVSGLFRRRGFDVTPFPHGECMSGSSTKRTAAHCRSAETGQQDRANAKPATCMRCPYHHVSEGYLRSLDYLAQEIETEALLFSKETLTAQRLRLQASDARQVVAFHRSRLETVV